MIGNNGTMGSNSDLGILTVNELGLNSQPGQSQSNGRTPGYQNAADWWQSRSPNPQQQQQTQPQAQPGNTDVDPVLAQLKAAMERKDLRTILKLAGIESTEALANLPSLAADDHAASFQNEIRSLKEQIKQQQEWIGGREQQEQQAERERTIQQGKAKLAEFVNRPEFVMINQLKQQDLIWEASANFAEQFGKPPNKDEILRMAVAIENSLRGQAKPLREMEWPGDELAHEAILGGSDSPPSPKPPASQSNAGQISRPIITNQAARSTEDNSGADPMSWSERRRRAIEAARNIRR